jgi:hypothetical protein
MASSENPWRAEDAEHHDIGANRLPDSTICSAATVRDMEDVLCNHLGQIVSVDFFTVPTIRLRVLFVFLVLEHRREVLHFNVTEHQRQLGLRNRWSRHSPIAKLLVI